MGAMIRTEIETSAAPDAIWNVLSDLSSYPRWNASIERLEGQLSPGQVLRLKARLPGGLRVGLRPIVSRVVPAHAFSWRAVLLHRTFFSAEHSFAIEDMPDRRVRVVQSEKFSGVFTPLFTLIFGPALRRSYEAANRSLKSRAERVSESLNISSPRADAQPHDQA